jgi:uncharacterized repeat protein (TIGR03803 family)
VRFPLAGLLADASGNLFGTTGEGAASDDGTVFEITGSGFGLVFAGFPGTVKLFRAEYRAPAAALSLLSKRPLQRSAFFSDSHALLNAVLQHCGPYVTGFPRP